MPNAQPVTAFFTSEWERFISGLRGLDPSVLEAIRFIEGRRGRNPNEPQTITIPGWDQIIHLGPRLEVTDQQWLEFFRAQREGRAPNLPAAVLSEIAWKQLTYEANRTSAQPGWAQNWGQIMTAIDNVQDFLSTLATLGRLALWLGSRIGLRAIPGLGWIILLSDLLNLMNFLGMVAMPVYALLCDGPRAALAAGVPAAVLRNALCREVWTMARLNPFGREARLRRALAALGRLPTIGNLIEVLQTTDNLFGVGISIGALYGMVLEALFATTGGGGTIRTTINTGFMTHGVGTGTANRFAALPQGHREVLEQAAKVMVGATAIATQGDAFPDHVHLNHMVALLGAVALASEFLNHPDTKDWLPAALAQRFPAPTQVGRTAAAMLPHVGDKGAGFGRWWIPGNPTHATGAELVHALAPPTTAAVGRFVKPRRNRPEMLFYGAALGQLTENLWHMIEPAEDAIEWQLAPDYKLLTGMASDGLLIPSNAKEGPAWRFWLSMRAELERRGGKLLDAPKVWELANAADVPLIKLLPPDAPFPVEWAPYFASLGDRSAVGVNPCPTCGAPHG